MVKCVDCGFLALRDLQGISKTIDPRSANFLLKAAREFDKPASPAGLAARRAAGDPDLLDKYLQSNSLSPECAEHVLDMALGGTYWEVINKERYCQQYVQWRPGDGFKEHREYKERQQFQDWQTRIEEQRMKFQEEQEKKAEERYQEQLKLTRQIHKRELLYLGLYVTIAILIITVIGSVIEAGWIPKWFGLAN